MRQAISFSDWLSGCNGPAILGADANTPAVDALDFDQVRTHWHTGMPRLKGGRGDDVLWGQAKVHRLRDALRVWLDDHPDELDEIRRLRPAGPLRVSHLTGIRRSREGTPRRFDSIWITEDFAVREVRYLYDEAVAAGSDHAVVVADPSLSESSQLSDETRVGCETLDLQLIWASGQSGMMQCTRRARGVNPGPATWRIGRAGCCHSDP